MGSTEMNNRCRVCAFPTLEQRARGYRLLTWSMVSSPLPLVHTGPHLDGPDGRPLGSADVVRFYRSWPDYDQPAKVTWGARQHDLTEYLRRRVVNPPVSKEIDAAIDAVMPWRRYFNMWFESIGQPGEEPHLIEVVSRAPRDIYA